MKSYNLTKKLLTLSLILNMSASSIELKKLNEWTLQDPISGSSKIRSRELVAEEYSNDWFIRNSNTYTLIAPKNGAVSGSSSVRCELIGEPGNTDDVWANKDSGETWTPDQSTSNNLYLKVRPQEALDDRVYLSQIHSKNSGSRPLLMVLWDESAEKITLEIKESNRSDSNIIRHDILGIKKNTTYKTHLGIKKVKDKYMLYYRVRLGNVTIDRYQVYFGKTFPNSTERLKKSWLNDELYFKAGVYNKTARNSSTPGGNFSKVEIYNINARYN